MENNLRFVEIVAAASRIGLYYTPISSHLTAGEVAYIVDNSRARVVFTSVALTAVAAEASGTCPRVEHWYLVDGDPTAGLESYAQAVAGQSCDPLPDERLGMALMYSSGTTGRPKGIVRPLPDVAPADSLAAVRMGRGLMKLRAGMTLLVPAPLYHAAPHAAAAAALQLGATIVVMEQVRCGGGAVPGRGAPDHPRPDGADHVRATPEAAGVRQARARSRVVGSGRPLRRTVPRHGQAADDRLARPDHLRVLRGNGVVRLHPLHDRGVARPPRDGRQGRAR